MTTASSDPRERHGNPWRLAIWSTAALLLLLPLIAMQFTRDVRWDLPDFVLFGAMLCAACGSYELATRVTASAAYRAAVGVALAAAFALVWINLAVGMIGGEDHPANRLFGGVLVVGAIGSVLARFRGIGMVRALVATALSQALVGAIALLAGSGDGLVLSGGFVALWLTSAWLFGVAARQQASSHAA